ncbi:MAG: Gfo/Idh/MocA family oxidoreductase [Planctomycetota bacterium]
MPADTPEQPDHSKHTPRAEHAGPSRRSFLTASATAAGALALGGMAGRARASDPIVPSVTPRGINPPKNGEPVRLAVIGTGGMGRAHCRAIASLKEQGLTDTNIVAVCDVNDMFAADAKQICEQGFGGTVTTTRDHRDIVGRDDIHAVLIASPEHWHAQHAVDALVSGKDVYVEKPMTLRLDAAMDLRRCVLDHPDRVFQVGTQMMMLPKYRDARRMIKEGRIGKPVWSQTSYCRNSYDGEWLYYEIDDAWKPGENLDWNRWLGTLGPREWDPEVYIRWRRYRDFSTGIIGDLLVHVLTPMVYALDMGWPTRVVASGGHYVDKKMENHDQVNLTVEFEGEHTLIIAGSTANEVGLETMIRGHEANLYLGGRNCVLRPERIYADDIDAETMQSADIGNDQDQLRLDFLRCVKSREKAQSDIDLASKVMVIVDLATRSMWDGAAYRFDPRSMRAERV